MSNAAKVLFELKNALAGLSPHEKLELLNTVGSACQRYAGIAHGLITDQFVEVVKDDRDDSSDVAGDRVTDRETPEPDQKL
ncbi:MAG TPA: hypothetical protein PK317_01685 [Coprothermobacter proteolyticus]|nr:hypothetical protein [Coprothermobacter proteolyticus]